MDSHQAGSQDNDPPRLFYPDEYDFAAIGHTNGGLSVFRSRGSTVTNQHIAAKLRELAANVEGLDA